MAIRVPGGFYQYCKRMGVVESLNVDGVRSIAIADFHPSQVGMVQAYELSRIADALMLGNNAAKNIATQVGKTNKIFQGIHNKLKTPYGE